jgi:hypothetical protein
VWSKGRCGHWATPPEHSFRAACRDTARQNQEDGVEVRVIVDDLPVRHGGGAEYVRQQLRALATVDPTAEFHTLLSPWSGIEDYGHRRYRARPLGRDRVRLRTPRPI